MNISVIKGVNSLLAGFSPRERSVLEGRYGLKDGNSKTLAEIGEEYGITRERVRQIEANTLPKLKENLANSEAKNFVELVKTHLKNVGGARRETLLLNDLRVMVADPNTPHLANKAHFILEV